MAYREIDRSTPNDGLGDDARTWAGKTNENMKELYSRSFMLNDWMVTRWTYDPNATSFDAFLDDDKIEGWADGAQTRWVSGIIKTASGFSFPDDLDDSAKFFKITDLIDIG